MKSTRINFMQKTSEKSFLFSLALSFIMAFATVAYFSSPLTVHVKTVRAEAETIQASTTTPGIPFSDLNIISLIEIPADLAFALSSPEIATGTPTVAKIFIEPPQKRGAFSAEPVRLIIPSIGLSAPVESVGENAKGEMEVPNGSSVDVGWYKQGTIPGNFGSAVIDAHVFAAFQKLQNLKVGSEVYVENADGDRLKFVVNDTQVYKLGELTSNMLFAKRDARRLNLITCAGEPTADGTTYTHRLVVYTTLAA